MPDPSTPSPPSAPVAAIVLAGGRGARLGGVDKASLDVAGRPLLDGCLDALPEVGEIVVVGPERTCAREVLFVREDPPLGGPAAGLYAGLDALLDAGLRTGLVALVAVDMPFVDSATWGRLLDAARADGAHLVDADGRRQLCALVEIEALVRVRPDGSTNGLPLHTVFGALDLADVRAHDREADDVDTPEDLARAREQR